MLPRPFVTRETLAELAQAWDTTPAELVRDLSGVVLNLQSAEAFKQWQKYASDIQATATAGSLRDFARQIGAKGA